MDKKYVSVHIESCGSSPGKFSMLALGACIVGDNSAQFYRELKPISDNYNISSLRVLLRGLSSMHNMKHIKEYDFESKEFDAKKTWEYLKEAGDDPYDVMREFDMWIMNATEGFQPEQIGASIKFHGMFVDWYFDNYYEGDNPLLHGGDDINSMFRGLTGNRTAHIMEIGIRPEALTFNALDHAIVQAKEFEYILEQMRMKQDR
jgi:ribonuclease T